MKTDEAAKFNAVLVVGMIVGLSWRISSEALDEVIAKPGEDFRYLRECKAVRILKRTLEKSRETARP